MKISRDIETANELIIELVEFGFDLDIAQGLAPIILPLMKDPRGFKTAIIEKEPIIASLCGYLTRH